MDSDDDDDETYRATKAGRDARVPFAARGWHYRGYLPHYDGCLRTQFVTFRLADSLPQTLLNHWRREVQRLANKQERQRELLKRVEVYLDRGYGATYLKHAQIALLVEAALLNLDGQQYKLNAWVIMPNHVHLLIQPLLNYSLSKILHSLKSFTASCANEMLHRHGKFWMNDYFDRYIRDDEHFQKAVRYIHHNPVKAGLCAQPEDWRFSSAYKIE